MAMNDEGQSVELERVIARARQVLHPDEIQNWLTSSNPFIPGNATPLIAIQTGHVEDAMDAIDAAGEDAFL
jgi:hypothetical protein